MVNRIRVNPVKKYKRFRLKWLVFFALAGVLIVSMGRKGMQAPEVEEPVRETEVSERDDLEYLEESPDIRVILQAGNYSNMYHSMVEVSFPVGGYVLCKREEYWEKHSVEPGECVSVGIGGEFDFSIQQDMLIAFMSHDEDMPLVVTSIERNRTTCSYYGRLEVTLENAGLLLVNALSLEQYLCGVVPSEMPASYHEEALKAQAILARTYAYKYLINPAYPEFGAHVDDSIAFQVYGNLDNNSTTSKAVADTAGILLFADRNLAQVYYYSTSCGFGTDGSAWGGESPQYLQARRIGGGNLQSADGSLKGAAAEMYYLDSLKQETVFRNMIENPFVEGYEAMEGWYRWQALGVEVDEEEILKRLRERYQARPEQILTQNRDGEYESQKVRRLGDIREIRVEERGPGGVCRSLIIVGTEATYKVLLEYNIRYVLCGTGMEVVKTDGTRAVCSSLLPSGFFYIDSKYLAGNVVSYDLHGGGYGHGVGMSQNGANRMAGQGMSCREILESFFPDTVLVSYKDTGKERIGKAVPSRGLENHRYLAS